MKKDREKQKFDKIWKISFDQMQNLTDASNDKSNNDVCLTQHNDEAIHRDEKLWCEITFTIK